MLILQLKYKDLGIWYSLNLTTAFLCIQTLPLLELLVCELIFILPDFILLLSSRDYLKVGWHVWLTVCQWGVVSFVLVLYFVGIWLVSFLIPYYRYRKLVYLFSISLTNWPPNTTPISHKLSHRFSGYLIKVSGCGGFPVRLFFYWWWIWSGGIKLLLGKLINGGIRTTVLCKPSVRKCLNRPALVLAGCDRILW